MSKEMSRDDAERMFCERILNESWSKVSQHTKAIEKIVERGTIESENDLPLLLAAAGAFLQRDTLDERMDQDILNNDICLELSPCGENPMSQCPCARSACLLNP
jgi:hypothetical protein